MISARAKSLLLPLLSICLTAATSCAARMEGRRSAPDGPGYETGELSVDGRERQYIVVAPSSAGEHAPVVIVLHGGGGSAESMTRMSGVLPVARRNGFIAVFPQGLGQRDGAGTWNAGGCCAYAMRQSIDDAKFISMLIDEIVARRGGDPKRIYLAGFSNGGMMTHVFAAAAPGKIAAMAVVSGAVFDGAPAPKAPVPAMLIHGRKDRVVPYAGGTSGTALVAKAQAKPFAPFSAAVERWLRANGCIDDPAEKVNGAVTRRVYSDCATGAPVETYVIDDGAHAWPGGERGREAGDSPSSDLSASEAMWSFFEKRAR